MTTNHKPQVVAHHNYAHLCSGGGDCPDVAFLDSGDLIVKGYIDGHSIFEELISPIPTNETAVRIPAALVSFIIGDIQVPLTH